MKVLKKKNKYEKVAPLPSGWVSLILAKNLADSNNKHRKSYARLVNLLEDGWKFCERQEYREALAKEKKESKPKNKSKNKNKNK